MLKNQQKIMVKKSEFRDYKRVLRTCLKSQKN